MLINISVIILHSNVELVTFGQFILSHTYYEKLAALLNLAELVPMKRNNITKDKDNESVKILIGKCIRNYMLLLKKNKVALHMYLILN